MLRHRHRWRHEKIENLILVVPERKTQDHLSVIVNNRSMQELQRTSSIFFNDRLINLICSCRELHAKILPIRLSVMIARTSQITSKFFDIQYPISVVLHSIRACPTFFYGRNVFF